MSQKTGLYYAALIVGSVMGLTACDDSSNADAGRDARADATGDLGYRDTGTADTGNGQDVVSTDATDAGSDAAPTDGSSDGGTCSGTVDPRSLNLYYPAVWLWRYDARPSAGAEAVHSFFFTDHGQLQNRPTPDATGGDCVYYAIPGQGSNALNAAPEANFGTLTLTVPTQSVLTFNYDTAMSRYVGPSLLSFSMPAGSAVAVNLAGYTADAGVDAGAAAEPGTLTINAPPAFDQASVPVPTFTRTTDTVITYTVPAEARTAAGADLIVQLRSWVEADRSKVIVCGVPACRGSITIPHALTERWAAGTQIRAYVDLVRQTPIPPASRPLLLRLSNGVRFIENVE